MLLNLVLSLNSVILLRWDTTQFGFHVLSFTLLTCLSAYLPCSFKMAHFGSHTVALTLIPKQLSTYIQNPKITSHLTAGPGHSTVTPATAVVDDTGNSLVVSVNLSKAFETVDDNIL